MTDKSFAFHFSSLVANNNVEVESLSILSYALDNAIYFSIASGNQENIVVNVSNSNKQLEISLS